MKNEYDYENLDNKTKEFLSDLAVLLVDHHVASMNVNCGDVRFIFTDSSEIRIDRFTLNKFYNLRSTKCFSDYIPKCMNDMPGE